MKRYLSLFLVLMLLCGMLAGCGAGSESMSYDNGYAADMEYMPGETMASSDSLTSESKTGNTGGSDRKLIKTVNITAESQNYADLILALDAHIAELGGYVQNREQYNGNRRSCTMTIRIPAQKLDLFVDHVSENANVISSSETATDVTLQYVDTEAKVTALETEQARLLDLLEAAESLDDILAIEARLSEVTYELERYASALKSLENQVSYATVNLTLREVEVLTPKEEPSVWSRISEGFVESLVDLGDFLTDVFVWLVVESPNLLVLALFIFLLVKLIAWISKVTQPKDKPEQKPQPQAQNPQKPQNPQQPK